MNGFGIAQYSNGDIYQGYFEQGIMKGFGLYFEASTKQYTLGFFEDGALTNLVEKFKATEELKVNFRKLNAKLNRTT